MKRQRHATAGSVEISCKSGVISTQADSVWAKSPTSATLPRHGAGSGPDGRVWAKYIDSRMKQFGTR